MSGLKPCPFCGGAARMSKSRGGEAWWVDCRCGVKGAMTRTETDAMGAWNHRVDLPLRAHLLDLCGELRDTWRGGKAREGCMYERNLEHLTEGISELVEALEEVEACQS